MRMWLKRTFAVFPWIVIVLGLIHFSFLGGWKDATKGRFHRQAVEMFTDVDGITKVQIYLLMGEDSQKNDEEFPLRPYGAMVPTYGTISLQRADLESFIDLWQVQGVNYWRQAMCHEPAYGFRFYRGDTLVKETSMCWLCSNFYFEPAPGMATWYGFVADGESATKLLDFCDSRLPYKR